MKVMIVNSFGKRLRELRIKKGMTQQELGKRFKASQSTIGMYERDEREPNFQLLQEIADFFEVSIDYLLYRTTNPNEVNVSNKTESRNLDSDTLNKIAAFFNVSPEWLLDRINQRSRIPDKEPILTRDLLQFLEKSDYLTYGGHPITEKQKRIILDFFKEVVIRNEEKLKE
jgi:transcriptional regulator with XRE-family HTH domain